MGDEINLGNSINSKTIITKIIGEMKNQFNSNLVETDASNSESQSNDDLPGGVKIKAEDIEEIQRIEPENGTDMSCDSSKELDEIKFEADESSGDVEDQVPLIMSFRKPNSVGKNQKTGRRSKRNKVQNVSNLKRSTRRRSKDCGETVLQSAIARKEKSYNETIKPQRLTRQLKPTQKILDNIASAAAMKQEKRKDKVKANKSKDLSETTQDDSSSSPKHEKGGSVTKPRNKRLKTHHVKDVKVETDGKCRRSSRNSSVNSAIDLNKEIEEDVSKKEALEEEKIDFNNCDDVESTNSVDASITARIISSRLCVCSYQSNLYACSDADESVNCTAIDCIGDKLIGCNNIVNSEEVSMMRPSPRIPYSVLCKIHRNRMIKHNCCPSCGLFCTHGTFVQCMNDHHYHRKCQLTVNDLECCPHCGESTPKEDVILEMVPQNPIYSLAQKSSNHYINLNTHESIVHDEVDRDGPSPPIISLSDLKLTRVSVGADESSHYDIDDLLTSIQEGNYQEVTTILSSKSVNINMFVQFDDGSSGTVLHYAAKKGLLPVIHMLKIARVNLDILDSEQYTPLMLAVMDYQNDTVKYLTRAGAEVTAKGMDGMSALHLAAKCGNLEATKILLSTALHIRGFIDFADDGGWTALIWACEHGHVDIVKYLLSEGADPILTDVEQNTALHWAAFSGSSKIVHMILSFGGDINKVNLNGDSSLHIAARQDNYNSALLLLTRGAKLNLNNKMGETPIDCCPENCQTYEALALNMHLQSLIAANDPPNTIKSNDVSGGREFFPVQCINEVDDEKVPTDFVYVTKNYLTSDTSISQNISKLQSCKCVGICNTNSCSCRTHSSQPGYENGKLSSAYEHTETAFIFECNELCTCSMKECKNKVVQKGSKQQFQIYKTPDKGWGLRTVKLIPRGTYVTEYIGEILFDKEANDREDDSYLFGLGGKGNNSHSIDAKFYGNVSRFINHSCSPNLVPVRVFIEHHDIKFPRIALFTSRDINPFEELCFDYGIKFWVIKYNNLLSCKCGISDCKYSEKAIESTIENYYKDY